MGTFDHGVENNQLVVTIHMVELLRSVKDKFPDDWPGPPPPPGTPTPRKAWDDLCDEVGKMLDRLGVSRDERLPGIPLPPLASNVVGGGPPLPPDLPDPLQALRQIAEAINEAETKLNEQNLIIAGGSVEADLDVNVGGVAVAHSKIVFNITPNPYGHGPAE